jgi:hypothetical protein
LQAGHPDFGGVPSVGECHFSDREFDELIESACALRSAGSPTPIEVVNGMRRSGGHPPRQIFHRSQTTVVQKNETGV